MLELHHIHKSFNHGTVNESTLFNDFHLAVDQGDFVSIIGSNGSGKSTLLNLICGSMSPDAGTIHIQGQDIGKRAEHERYQMMGRVFQDPAFGTAPSMTLLENLSMAENKGKSWGLSWGIQKDRIEAYKTLLAPIGLGLEDKLHVKVGRLSGGQRQALALLMATLTPIEFLILDEHTAALDPKTADIVMEMTNRLIKEKNLTALMVTHNLNYALTYGNRLLMMHEGNIVLDKSGQEKKDLVLDDILSQFYEISIKVGNSL